MLVWCQDEATATATQEAAHCVNALMVTLIAVWVLTLINIEAVRRFVVAVSLPVEAVTGVTGADNSSKVISALLLAGRRSAYIYTFRYALAHHEPESFTAFPPKTSAVLASSSYTGIFHCQDLIFWTLCPRGVYSQCGPDRTGPRFPQKHYTHGADW